MQPISEILKSIPFPVWLCWGISIFGLVFSTLAIMHIRGEEKSFFSSIPLPAFFCVVITIGMILYCENDSICRRKELDLKMAKFKCELDASLMNQQK